LLNWRPAVDYELRKIEFERLAELSAISFSSDTSSTPPNAMPGESEM
jgi:hypothetical protein